MYEKTNFHCFDAAKLRIVCLFFLLSDMIEQFLSGGLLHLDVSEEFFAGILQACAK